MKTNKITLIVIALLILGIKNTQAQTSRFHKVWQKNIGGTDHDGGARLLRMPNGDYVLGIVQLRDSALATPFCQPSVVFGGSYLTRVVVLDSNTNFKTEICPPSRIHWNFEKMPKNSLIDLNLVFILKFLIFFFI